MTDKDPLTAEQVKREADYWREAAKDKKPPFVPVQNADLLRDICDDLHKRMTEARPCAACGEPARSDSKYCANHV